MVDIQSKEVIDKISDELKVQPALQIPRALSNNIQLVYESGPRRVVNIVRQADSASTGATSIYTTPADQDFFLVGFSMSAQYNAAADNTFIQMDFTAEGNISRPIELNKLTLTAFTGNLSNDFSIPIKLKRGSVIRVTSNFTVGAGVRGATIWGYTTDPQ